MESNHCPLGHPAFQTGLRPLGEYLPFELGFVLFRAVSELNPATRREPSPHLSEFL